MAVPECTMRWKGICHEAGYGDNLHDYCWLDYLVASTGVRLTFLWHTVNREANLQEVATRVHNLKQAAGRAPDVLLTRPRLRTLLDGAGPQAPGVHGIWKSLLEELYTFRPRTLRNVVDERARLDQVTPAMRPQWPYYS
eukprot:scaffold2403_cov65-Phaeocystis_antarctica.AAC.1